MGDNSDSPPVGRIAAANRACENCSHAKAKCISQLNGTDPRCARCFRLKKACVIPIRRKRKKRSAKHTANVNQLEEKIESLVSLLAGAQANALSLTQQPPAAQITDSNNANHDGQSNAPQITPNSPINHSHGIFPLAREIWSPGIEQKRLSVNTPVSNSRSTEAQEYTSATSLNSGTTPRSGTNENTNSIYINDEAERHLQLFKDQFATKFPFIQVPLNISSRALFAQRPYVYKAIMVVTSQHRRKRQLEMAAQFCVDIAAALVTRGEKSLDMLQGLIIHNVWCYYHSPTPPPMQSVTIFQLSFSLVFDLGLHKPVRDGETSPMLPEMARLVPENNPKELKRTLEERRTFLSCYVSTSVLALYLRKIEGLQHTPYLEYNAKVLGEAAESLSDLVLVALVKLQGVSESFQQNIMTRSRGIEGVKAPYWMYVKAMKNELEALWASLTPEVQSDKLVLMTYYSAQVFLYGPCIQPASYPISFCGNQAERLDILYLCLIASQSLLDACLNYTTPEFNTFSIIQLAHIGHGLASLFKLSLVDESGWDLRHIRSMVNIFDYTDQFVSRFGEAGASIDQSQDEPCRDSFPTGCANAMSRVRASYESKLAQLEQAGTQAQIGMAEMVGIFNMSQLDWIDDAYWEDMLNSASIMHT